jgi:hypothetical protein
MLAVLHSPYHCAHSGRRVEGGRITAIKRRSTGASDGAHQYGDKPNWSNQGPIQRWIWDIATELDLTLFLGVTLPPATSIFFPLQYIIMYY